MSIEVKEITGLTSTCQHCGKGIRCNSQGGWGARKRDDPHPWYCDASKGGEKRHEPTITATSPLTLDAEAEQMAREERWT